MKEREEMEMLRRQGKILEPYMAQTIHDNIVSGSLEAKRQFSREIVQSCLDRHNIGEIRGRWTDITLYDGVARNLGWDTNPEFKANPRMYIALYEMRKALDDGDYDKLVDIASDRVLEEWRVYFASRDDTSHVILTFRKIVQEACVMCNVRRVGFKDLFISEMSMWCWLISKIAMNHVGVVDLCLRHGFQRRFTYSADMNMDSKLLQVVYQDSLLLVIEGAVDQELSGKGATCPMCPSYSPPPTLPSPPIQEQPVIMPTQLASCDKAEVEQDLLALMFDNVFYSRYGRYIKEDLFSQDLEKFFYSSVARFLGEYPGATMAEFIHWIEFSPSFQKLADTVAKRKVNDDTYELVSAYIMQQTMLALVNDLMSSLVDWEEKDVERTLNMLREVVEVFDADSKQ